MYQYYGHSNVIFSVAKKLIKGNNDPMFSHHTTLVNRFSEFFHYKIQMIKANIMIELRFTRPKLAAF